MSDSLETITESSGRTSNSASKRDDNKHDKHSKLRERHNWSSKFDVNKIEGEVTLGKVLKQLKDMSKSDYLKLESEKYFFDLFNKKGFKCSGVMIPDTITLN